MTSEIWWVVKEKPFPIVFYTMPPAFVEHGSTGSNSAAGSSTIGLPTVFFTHSAADNQWLDLARLICSSDPQSASSRSKAVVDNPVISDWFFSHQNLWNVLGASDYWFRFEWQHVEARCSLPPDVQFTTTAADSSDIAQQQLLKYVDNIVSTTNPAIQPDTDTAP